jgi:hypothetical protein
MAALLVRLREQRPHRRDGIGTKSEEEAARTTNAARGASLEVPETAWATRIVYANFVSAADDPCEARASSRDQEGLPGEGREDRRAIIKSVRNGWEFHSDRQDGFTPESQLRSHYRYRCRPRIHHRSLTENKNQKSVERFLEQAARTTTCANGKA